MTARGVQRSPRPQHPCFSGTGALTRSRWAPGQDTRYWSRLCRAHMAGDTLPDPWYIAQHGGLEAAEPDGGWPQLDPMEIAERLDQELISAARVWVPRLIDYHRRHVREAPGVISERRQAVERRALLRSQVIGAQLARPDAGEIGSYFGTPATVRARMDPARLLIEVDGHGPLLISDGDFTRKVVTP